MLPDNVLLMARVLILYGTTDGHTRKIATALREALVDEGVYAFISDARYGTETVVAEDYDGVIVAASIHAGGFQRPAARCHTRATTGSSVGSCGASWRRRAATRTRPATSSTPTGQMCGYSRRRSGALSKEKRSDH